MGSSASSARSAQACRQCGSRAPTASTAGRRWPAGRARAASRAAANSGSSGSRTVSGLPEVNWTACSGVTRPCYERGTATKRPPNGDRTGTVTAARRNVVVRRGGSTLRAELTPDPRPTSFQNHPGLRDREPEARELADVLRRLIRLSVTASPPAAETVRLTTQLAALADELERHLPADPLPRFIPPDEDGPPKDVPLGGAMPYDVVVGPFNPVALPLVLDFEPPKALGRGVFDVTYEGAPGCVHGAVLVAAFDIILTAAANMGAVGPTVSLAARYVRPPLIGEKAVFEGWVTQVTERRIFSKGRVVQGGVVTVEAEGEFAIFNQDRVNRLASSRRRTSDPGTGPGPS